MGCFGIGLADIFTFLITHRFKSLGLESRIVEVDNASRIHCWVPEKSRHGHKPALILIHGFGGDGTLGWSNQIPTLVKDFALYVPDLFFFGQSYTTSKQRSEVFQAQCMLQLLKLQGVTKFSALGSSYGGFVAFHMAHLAPNLVQKVVLASSGICMDQAYVDRLLAEESKCSDIADALIPKDKAGIRNAMDTVFYKPLRHIPDFLIAELKQRFNCNREEKIQLLKGTQIGSKDSPPLPLLNQEVLIVWGQGDRIFPVEQAYKLQKHLGWKANLVVIPKAGHVPQIESPKEFNRHILAFLKDKKHSPDIIID